jgi:quercetin dioxygenase-like cupin family protein
VTTAQETRTSRWGPLRSDLGEAPTLSDAERTEVCRGLAATVGSERLRNLEERSWEVIGRTDEYEAWLIGWPPGGRVRFHDHGRSGGSVLVLEGSLLELTPVVRRHEVLRLERHRYTTGGLLEFGPGHVHDLVNDGDAFAVSLHVYSPRLESMTYFDLGPRGIVERETRGPVEEAWMDHLP